MAQIGGHNNYRGSTWTTAGLILTAQTSCPFPSTQTGIWMDDSYAVKRRNADGTDTVIASALAGVQVIRVNAVITSNLAGYTYANGTAGVGATLTAGGNGAFSTQDGVAAALNNVYLVAGQSTGAQNGAFKLTTLGTGSTPAILTRLEAFDTSDDMKDGTLFVVMGGTTNADTTWKFTTASSPTVGTTSLSFARDPGVVTTNTAQTITGAKDFAAGTLKADNDSTTNAHTFVSAATAARTVTLPDASFTVPQDSLVAHLAGAETITGAKDFAASALKIDNNSTTNAHTMVSAATAARNWTLPDATDTAVGLAATQTLTNKTLTAPAIGGAATLAAAATVTAAAGAGSMDLSAWTGALSPPTVANDQLTPGVEVIHKFIVPAGTTGDVDFVIAKKTEILDVHLVKTTAAGGGAGTIQAKNGSDVITNAMSIDINDKVIARCTEIDDAFNVIAAGGTLRFTRTRTASSDESCIVVVRGILRA